MSLYFQNASGRLLVLKRTPATYLMGLTVSGAKNKMTEQHTVGQVINSPFVNISTLMSY